MKIYKNIKNGKNKSQVNFQKNKNKKDDILLTEASDSLSDKFIQEILAALKNDTFKDMSNLDSRFNPAKISRDIFGDKASKKLGYRDSDYLYGDKKLDTERDLSKPENYWGSGNDTEVAAVTAGEVYNEINSFAIESLEITENILASKEDRDEIIAWATDKDEEFKNTTLGVTFGEFPFPMLTGAPGVGKSTGVQMWVKLWNNTHPEEPIELVEFNMGGLTDVTFTGYPAIDKESQVAKFYCSDFVANLLDRECGDKKYVLFLDEFNRSRPIDRIPAGELVNKHKITLNGFYDKPVDPGVKYLNEIEWEDYDVQPKIDAIMERHGNKLPTFKRKVHTNIKSNINNTNKDGDILRKTGFIEFKPTKEECENLTWLIEDKEDTTDTRDGSKRFQGTIFLKNLVMVVGAQNSDLEPEIKRAKGETASYEYSRELPIRVLGDKNFAASFFANTIRDRMSNLVNKYIKLYNNNGVDDKQKEKFKEECMKIIRKLYMGLFLCNSEKVQFSEESEFERLARKNSKGDLRFVFFENRDLSKIVMLSDGTPKSIEDVFMKSYSAKVNSNEFVGVDSNFDGKKLYKSILEAINSAPMLDFSGVNFDSIIDTYNELKSEFNLKSKNLSTDINDYSSQNDNQANLESEFKNKLEELRNTKPEDESGIDYKNWSSGLTDLAAEIDASELKRDAKDRLNVIFDEILPAQNNNETVNDDKDPDYDTNFGSGVGDTSDPAGPVEREATDDDLGF